MMKRVARVAAIVAVVLTGSSLAVGRDAARDLRRMIGFTILDASAVAEVSDGDYSAKFIRLQNGYVFKVEMLLLPPLPLTDVIVFAKRYPQDLLQKFGKDVPEWMQFQFKLLIDNESYDATPVRR